MALESSFANLENRLQRLREAIAQLGLTVVEDKPSKRDVILMDQIGDAVDDMMGCTEEALAAIRTGNKAVTQAAGLDQARRALAGCQQQLHRLLHHFLSELVSPERIDSLTAFGRERKGEWLAWATAVKHGLDQTRVQVEDTMKALFQCWQEIGERIGCNTVSVQATGVGRQVLASRPENEWVP